MDSVNEKYNVIVSRRAAEMLVSHARFLANVSEEAAQTLMLQFSNAAKSLEYFPERQPWLNDLTLPANKYRKLLFQDRYLVLYQIISKQVYIDYIVDCRQGYRWIL
jgi:hypothetical protein